MKTADNWNLMIRGEFTGKKLADWESPGRRELADKRQKSESDEYVSRFRRVITNEIFAHCLTTTNKSPESLSLLTTLIRFPLQLFLFHYRSIKQKAFNLI